MSFNKQPLTDNDLKWAIGDFVAILGITLFWVLVIVIASFTGLLWALWGILAVATTIGVTSG